MVCADLAYLSMLFILEVQSSRINSMLKKANYVGNGASCVRLLGSYDGAWYTEHNGNTIVTVSQMLME